MQTVSHLYIHVDHDGFQTSGQRQRRLDRHGFMRLSVRVRLVVIGIRPERKAVFQRLGAGKWQVFGAHGMKTEYSLTKEI